LYFQPGDVAGPESDIPRKVEGRKRAAIDEKAQGLFGHGEPTLHLIRGQEINI